MEGHGSFLDLPTFAATFPHTISTDKQHNEAFIHLNGPTLAHAESLCHDALEHHFKAPTACEILITLTRRAVPDIRCWVSAK